MNHDLINNRKLKTARRGTTVPVIFVRDFKAILMSRPGNEVSLCAAAGVSPKDLENWLAAIGSPLVGIPSVSGW
jgi:hypothetical protein